jgi:hypothetical protein
MARLIEDFKRRCEAIDGLTLQADLEILTGAKKEAIGHLCDLEGYLS